MSAVSVLFIFQGSHLVPNELPSMVELLSMVVPNLLAKVMGGQTPSSMVVPNPVAKGVG